MILSSFPTQAQEVPTRDSLMGSYGIQDIKITGYIQTLEQFASPASTAVLTREQIRLHSPASMVSVMNTIPGIRMEERSPGSYRLSIRGSLVRSPYGVRNVKVYYDGFALTDGGGNTYLNALNTAGITSVEVSKGPDGSLFGANSGGVVQLGSMPGLLDRPHAGVFAGSYGLVGNAAGFNHQTANNKFYIRQSFQRADGYRDNTRNRRLLLQAGDSWNYNRENRLDVSVFYSDFNYRTPGGLTREQYEQNPRQSRPATARLPGSAEQNTGSEAKMFFAGVRHHARLTGWMKHVISIWGNYVDYANSAISNYETRDETNLGVRTYFSLSPANNLIRDFRPSLDVGFEGQMLRSKISNYDNLGGTAGALQAYNKIGSHQYFPFLNATFRWKERLVVRGAMSVNFNGYDFKDETGIKNNFDPVWMPHLGANYIIAKPLSVRLTVSRGYSTPTIAEIRPTDNKIYDNLQPEKGWNTEAGLRLNFLDGRLIADASVFHYLLKDGIISNVNETGDTYFTNSGRIKQLGVETALSWIVKPWSESEFVRMIRIDNSYNYSRFRYDKFVTADKDHTGNRVAGVPSHTIVTGLELRFPECLYLFLQHNYTSRIPVNDANTEYADHYNLVWLKVGIDRRLKSKWPVNAYVAIDNLLDQKYSLGNDINAFGGRYYNAAPGINFVAGLEWFFN